MNNKHVVLLWFLQCVQFILQCRKLLDEREALMGRDYKMSHPLVHACEKDIKQHCAQLSFDVSVSDQIVICFSFPDNENSTDSLWQWKWKYYKIINYLNE